MGRCTAWTVPAKWWSTGSRTGNISAEQAVLSFAGWFNGYAYAVVVRRTKDGEAVVPQPLKEPQQDTLF